MNVKQALKQLQGAVRSEGDVREVAWHQLPRELVTDDHQMLRVGRVVRSKIREAAGVLLADPHFEHLGDDTEKAVWRFACYAACQRTENHVPGFLSEHSRELTVRTAFFGIDDLAVSVPFSIGDVNFLPLPDSDTDSGSHFRNDSDCKSVAKVVLRGTHDERMLERGRDEVLHALRILRISLANLEQLHDSQLRFRLGQLFIVEDYGQGFARREGSPLTMDLPEPPAELFPSFDLLDISYGQASKVERQATLALKWIDEARLALDPLHRVVFLFSALEAMLGDRSEGLKAPTLVYYRTLLGQVVSGKFPHPNPLYYFYDEIRSSAVHGEVTPALTVRDVDELEWNIRSALTEFVQFYTSREFTSRRQVREALRASEHAERALEFLRDNDPADWWNNWSPSEDQSPK